MKKLTLNCNFQNGTSPMSFYVGEAADGTHPIQFQTQWLAREYGGSVPEEIMESLRNLKAISEKNRIAFEELCEYVFEEVNATKEIADERNFSKQQIVDAAKHNGLLENEG